MSKNCCSTATRTHVREFRVRRVIIEQRRAAYCFPLVCAVFMSTLAHAIALSLHYLYCTIRCILVIKPKLKTTQSFAPEVLVNKNCASPSLVAQLLNALVPLPWIYEYLRSAGLLSLLI